MSFSRGRPLPLGASPDQYGVNFVLACRNGNRVWLVLSPEDSNQPFVEYELDRRTNRTGRHWHVHVVGLPQSFRYGWRVDGPESPFERYNPRDVLIDPAATTIAGSSRWGEFCETDRHHSVRRSLFRIGPHYDWKDDQPPLIAPEDSIIYELNVRSFTCHESAGVKFPGTFAGLIEKLPYLKSLGVTAIELLPVHEFDECNCPFFNPLTGEKNRNLWGYNSIAFAAPKASYAARGYDNEQVDEFRDLVRSCHTSQIEVILDVVFNHTAEGGKTGRTYSFRGLDNSTYYLLDADGKYLDFTGCGNTMNCNHPVVRDLIMSCLRYWVSRMHVDGFRFDLASVFGRDTQGHVLQEPPVVEIMVEDNILADTKLIAEPWDAAGLYQVGQFPYGRRWYEWNAKYRDDVRKFWRGDRNMVATFMTRFCGSADLYQPTGRKPFHSINFVTCHDGFTLWDLVSYSRKHNEMNGEGNRDGAPDNFSANYGVEGETDDRTIVATRIRQAKNMIATLMLSQGVPMLLAGDEFLRTQRGNNNAWCQDNEISWFDWQLANRNADFLRFVRLMIAFRRQHSALRRREFFHGASKDAIASRPDISWHGLKPDRADFDPDSHFIACVLNGAETYREADDDLYLAFNAGIDALNVELPSAPNGNPWHMVVDTSLESPNDIVEKPDRSRKLDGTTMRIASRSTFVAIALRSSR